MSTAAPSGTSVIDGPEANAAIRAENPGCIFPLCMCRARCVIAQGGEPDDGNPFKRIPYASQESHRSPKTS